MRGVGEACKCIQHRLLHSAKARCLIASVVTPRGPEFKQLPLRTLTSSRITSDRLPVIVLMPKEREGEKGAKVEWKRLGI
jgi:hypothetical protein